MAIQYYKAPVEIDEAFSSLSRDGVVVLKGLEAPTTLDDTRHDLEPWLSLPADQSPMGNNPFTGMKTLRTSGLIAKSAHARHLVANPQVLAISEKTLGPLCSRFQLSFTQAIKITPGESAQPLHRDTSMYPLKRPGPEVFLNAIWAATEFTEKNGATRFILGSHLWPDDRRPTAETPIVQATLEAGDVAVYLGSVLHGGGQNSSSDDRVAISFGYTLGWLRQEENQYLAVPPDLVETFDPSLQRLLGFAEHFPFLGWHEGQDHEIFRGGVFNKQYDAEGLEGASSKSLGEILAAGTPLK